MAKKYISLASELPDALSSTTRSDFQAPTFLQDKMSSLLKEDFFYAKLATSNLKSESPMTSSYLASESRVFSPNSKNVQNKKNKLCPGLMKNNEVSVHQYDGKNPTLLEKLSLNKLNLSHSSFEPDGKSSRKLATAQVPNCNDKKERQFHQRNRQCTHPLIGESTNLFRTKGQRSYYFPTTNKRATSLGTETIQNSPSKQDGDRNYREEIKCLKKIKSDAISYSTVHPKSGRKVEAKCEDWMATKLSALVEELLDEEIDETNRLGKGMMDVSCPSISSLSTNMSLKSSVDKEISSFTDVGFCGENLSARTKALLSQDLPETNEQDDLICVEEFQPMPLLQRAKTMEPNHLIFSKTRSEYPRGETIASREVNQNSENYFRSTTVVDPLECDESAEKLFFSRGGKSALSFDLTLKKQRSNFLEYRSQKSELQQPSAASTLEDELKKFEKALEILDQEKEIEKSLLNDEVKQLIDPHYLQNRQKNITAVMRAILFDWMMEVASEFGLKRETYSLATSYVDRYLSKCEDLEKSQFQLLGATALYLSMKAEETSQYRISDIATTTAGGYTAEQIAAMEIKLCKGLGWRLHLPTTEFWLTFCLQRWDKFVDSSHLIVESNLIDPDTNFVKFMQPSQECYEYFREISQILDTAKLDIEFLQYDVRQIIASLLYLVAGKHHGQLTIEEIIRDVPNTSVFLFEDRQGFNQVYKAFLKSDLDFTLEELLPSLQYVAKYFILPLCFDPPQIAKAHQAIVIITLEIRDLMLYLTEEL